MLPSIAQPGAAAITRAVGNNARVAQCDPCGVNQKNKYEYSPAVRGLYFFTWSNKGVK